MAKKNPDGTDVKPPADGTDVKPVDVIQDIIDPALTAKEKKRLETTIARLQKTDGENKDLIATMQGSLDELTKVLKGKPATPSSDVIKDKKNASLWDEVISVLGWD